MSGSEIRWQKSVQSKDSTEAFLRNIFFVAPIIYAISLVVSFFAMYLYNGWDIPTTMFYATQSLLGCLYPVPEPPNDVSKLILNYVILQSIHYVVGFSHYFLNFPQFNAIHFRIVNGLH